MKVEERKEPKTPKQEQQTAVIVKEKRPKRWSDWKRFARDRNNFSCAVGRVWRAEPRVMAHWVLSNILALLHKNKRRTSVLSA